MYRFERKTVIVTGAGGGIGAGIARRFAAEGANVVLVTPLRARLEALAESFDPGRCLLIEADVDRPGDAQRIVAETLARFGAIDCLVNNAGTRLTGNSSALAEEEEEAAPLATDLTGVYRMTRAAWEALKASGGSVVNTAPACGMGGAGDANEVFAYNAARGGVANLTRALALDAARSGVRVNAVNPSQIRLSPGGQNEARAEECAEGRSDGITDGLSAGLATPGDIAGVVAFLASEDARFVNGVNLPLDGGLPPAAAVPRARAGA